MIDPLGPTEVRADRFRSANRHQWSPQEPSDRQRSKGAEDGLPGEGEWHECHESAPPASAATVCCSTSRRCVHSRPRFCWPDHPTTDWQSIAAPAAAVAGSWPNLGRQRHASSRSPTTRGACVL